MLFMACSDPGGLPSSLQANIWAWEEFPGNTRIVPDEPAKYRLSIFKNGSFQVQTPCKFASGTFRIQDNQLSFEPIPITSPCVGDFFAQSFLNALKNAQSYLLTNYSLKNNTLTLLLQDKSEMVFVPSHSRPKSV